LTDKTFSQDLILIRSDRVFLKKQKRILYPLIKEYSPDRYNYLFFESMIFQKNE